MKHTAASLIVGATCLALAITTPSFDFIIAGVLLITGIQLAKPKTK
jgi:hypothetical protein